MFFNGIVFKTPLHNFVKETFGTSHAHDAFLSMRLGIFSTLTNTTKEFKG
jgi:hypothetical protein